MPYFAHHSILITGATGGIGRALTHALTEAGALVVATGRSTEALERLTGAPSDTLKKIPADLSELEYGVSVTDGCIGWEETEAALRDMRDKLRDVLPKRKRNV